MVSQMQQRILGIAMCKLSGSCDDIEGFQSGRKLLEDATKPPHKDAEGLCALADIWRAEDEDQAQELYHRSLQGL